MKSGFKSWWKQLRCKHTRTVNFYPGELQCIVPAGKTVKHKSVVIDGCLNCGKVIVRDYGE
jgi:hypothetical protein